MELAEVHHQSVHLSINPSAQVLHGWTELQASVPQTASALGLHALGLEISSVTVNGQPVQWQLRPSPAPGLAKDAPTAKDISEQAYHDYITAVKYERAPQLEVSLPPHLVGTTGGFNTQIAAGLQGEVVVKQETDHDVGREGDVAGQRDQGVHVGPMDVGAGRQVNLDVDPNKWLQSGLHKSRGVSPGGGLSADTPPKQRTGTTSDGAPGGSAGKSTAATHMDVDTPASGRQQQQHQSQQQGQALTDTHSSTPLGQKIGAVTAAGKSSKDTVTPKGPGSSKKHALAAAAAEPAVPRTTVCVRIAFARPLQTHSCNGAVMLVCGDNEGGVGQASLATSLAGLLNGGLGEERALDARDGRPDAAEGSVGVVGQGLSLEAAPHRLDLQLSQQQRAGSIGGTFTALNAPPGAVLHSNGTMADGCDGVGPKGQQLYFVSDAQLRRARSLFPCVDDVGRVNLFELWLSVPPDYVAVSGGELKGSMLTLAEGGTQVPHARTFHFAPGMPVTAAHMLVSAGPMAVQPGYQPAPPLLEGTRFTVNGAGGGEFGSAMRSVLNEVAKEGSAAGAGPPNMHTRMYATNANGAPAPPPACAFTIFAPPGLVEMAAYTARPLYLIQREMEAYLDCPLPCSQLHVVFLPPAALQGLACDSQQAIAVGANVILASTEILVGPESVEGVMESCVALAGAMARQWFGILMQPTGAEDAWVLEGLAAYLEDVFARAAMGQNDVAWRRHKEREAVALADDGAMPPLYPHHARSGGRDGGRDKAKQGPRLDQGATGAEDYGCSFGTEMLEPGPMRRWKAAAVIRMLEARTGVDEFRRMLQTTVRKAMQSVGLKGGQEESVRQQQQDEKEGIVEPASLQSPRLVSTQTFLRLVKQYAGRKGLDAFAERWIYGRGCPRFTLGMKYNKMHNSLLFGMRQSGSAASQRSARAALAVGRVSKQGIDESLGHVKIHVQESHATSEAMIRVGPQDSLVFHEHLLACRPGMKKPGRKPKAETLAKAQREAEEANERLDADEQAGKHPVKFVRIDARCEWLCQSDVRQAENLWVNQLLHSKDVVAQTEAVKGFACLASTGERRSEGLVATLEACLKDRSIFSRVRAEVALVMGATADPMSDFAAVPILCKFFDDATRDPCTRQLRPNAFNDLSEYIVLRSLPRALAYLRDGLGRSPPEVLDVLLGFLDHSDNTGNPYSDAHFTARFIEALGYLKIPTPSQLVDVLRLLDRHLALEDMLPSPNHIVGRACLTALGQLAGLLGSWNERNCKAHEGVRHTLRTYASPNVALPLRQAAAQAMIYLESAVALLDDKVRAIVSKTLELLKEPGWGASGATALIAGALSTIGQLPPSEVAEDEADALNKAIAPEALQLYNLVHNTTDARLRQCAFMLLMRATGEDPTLYRDREEEEEVVEEEKEPSKQPQPTQSLGTHTQGTRSAARSGMIMGLGFSKEELEKFQEEERMKAAAEARQAAPPLDEPAKPKVNLSKTQARIRALARKRPGSPSHTGVSNLQTSTFGGGTSFSRQAPTDSHTQQESLEQQQEVEQPLMYNSVKGGYSAPAEADTGTVAVGGAAAMEATASQAALLASPQTAAGGAAPVQLPRSQTSPITSSMPAGPSATALARTTPPPARLSLATRGTPSPAQPSPAQAPVPTIVSAPTIAPYTQPVAPAAAAFTSQPARSMSPPERVTRAEWQPPTAAVPGAPMPHEASAIQQHAVPLQQEPPVQKKGSAGIKLVLKRPQKAAPAAQPFPTEPFLKQEPVSESLPAHQHPAQAPVCTPAVVQKHAPSLYPPPPMAPVAHAGPPVGYILPSVEQHAPVEPEQPAAKKPKYKARKEKEPAAPAPSQPPAALAAPHVPAAPMQATTAAPMQAALPAKGPKLKFKFSGSKGRGGGAAGDGDGASAHASSADVGGHIEQGGSASKATQPVGTGAPALRLLRNMPLRNSVVAGGGDGGLRGKHGGTYAPSAGAVREGGGSVQGNWDVDGKVTDDVSGGAGSVLSTAKRGRREEGGFVGKRQRRRGCG